MHIVFIILGLITTIAIWSWRLRMARGAAHEAFKVAEAAANMPRKLAFQYKASKNGLALIHDPREAAAIMMTEVALARGGQLTERQSAAISAQIRENFGFSETETEDLAAHAVWVTESSPSPVETMRTLSAVIVNSPDLGPKEVVELDTMLTAISEADGTPTPDQLALLRLYRDKAGLKS